MTHCLRCTELEAALRDLEQRNIVERYGRWHHAKPNGKCADDCPACERKGATERIRFTADFEGVVHERDNLTEELAKARKEAKNAADNWGRTLTGYLDRVNAAEAALRDLKAYVQHKFGCSLTIPGLHHQGCTCGLAKAEASLPSVQADK